MSKTELTQEQKDFRLEPNALNRQFIYWLDKSKCIEWDLRLTNQKYNDLRQYLDHGTAMDKLKREMFKNGLKS